MPLIFRNRIDGTERSSDDPAFWPWINSYCVGARAPKCLTRTAAPILKLRDVVILMAATRLNLTNEDIARGICARKPGHSHGLAAGNVTRALARVNDAIGRLFDVRIVADSDSADPPPPELALMTSPPPETAVSADHCCPFCGSRDVHAGLCFGCGSDVDVDVKKAG